METSPDLTLSFAEYLVIFNTFVFGYVTTQFFTGWSSVISHREKLVISVEHLTWTIFAFILLTDIWWGSWLKTARIVEHNYYFYVSLLSPIVFYFLTVFLFPDPDHYSQGDLITYLQKEFKRIAILFVLLFLSFLVGSVVFGNVMSTDVYFNIAGMSLSALAYFYHTIWFRRFILGIGIVALLFHIWMRAGFEPGHLVLGFSFVEYLTVFITFIYGFVASRFLHGWGVLLKGYRTIPCGTEYIAWTLLAFGLMMDMWWNSWQRGVFIERSIVNFMFALSVPLLFYFFSAALFPVELIQSGYTNMKSYFERHKMATFLLLGLIMVSNFVIANLASDGDLLTAENFMRLIAIAMAGTALVYTASWYQKLTLVAAWSLLILHSVILSMR